MGDPPPDVHRDHDHAHAPPLAGRGHHRAPVQPRLLLRTHAQIFFRQFRNPPHSRDCSHCGQENPRWIIRDSYSEEKGNIIQNQFCLFGIHVEKDRRSPLVMIPMHMHNAVQCTLHITLHRISVMKSSNDDLRLEVNVQVYIELINRYRMQ